MSFQARAQKSAMWPASRPIEQVGELVDHLRAAPRVRRSLSVKTRFSPTTPVSPCTKTRMQPKEWIWPSALPIGWSSRS